VAALASWLDARAHGGRWLVRIEDVDGPRSVAGAAEGILATLRAFGLDWDGEVVRQTARSDLYRSAFDRLRAVPKGFGNSRGGQELAAALDAALADPDRKAPLVERSAGAAPSAGPTIELLKVLLRTAAEMHDVAARLIATTADIEAIATSDDADVPALSGWRRELFGEHALALKQGRLALSLENGKVSVKAI
jgi:hypothetical protein